MNATLYEEKFSAYFYIQEQKVKGNYIAFPELNYSDSTWQRSVREVFLRESIFCITDSDRVHTVLSNLNRSVESRDERIITLPELEGEIDWVVRLPGGIELHINCFRKYYSDGEESFGVKLLGVMTPGSKPTTNSVKRAVAWLTKQYNAAKENLSTVERERTPQLASLEIDVDT